MKETAESARNWHKLGFLVSATALVLLFASYKTDYRAALDEAYILRDLRLADYQQWVRGFLGQNTLLPTSSSVETGTWQKNITLFLSSKLGFQVGGSPNWNITEIVEYERAPTNGTLGDWYSWVGSSKPASYYHPDWGTARLSASRDGVGITSPPNVRYFSLRASSWHRFDGEYSFRAYVELNGPPVVQTNTGVGQLAKTAWWTSLEQLDSRDLFEQHMHLGLDETKFVVEGDVGSQLKVVNANCGIRQWLESTGLWAKISKTDGTGEVVLPEMRLHWSDLRDRSLGDATAFMEQKQQEIQDVSLLGLPVPGQLCVVAIPLAYFVIHLFLLLDVRSLRHETASAANAELRSVAWLALYDDTAAKWVTALSLTLVPTLLSVALLVKYHERVPEYSVIVAAIGAAATLAVGGLTYRTVTEILKDLSRDKQAG